MKFLGDVSTPTFDKLVKEGKNLKSSLPTIEDIENELDPNK
jgi:hypothetical protein